MRPEMNLTQNCPKCGSRRVAPYQCKDESCWQCWNCGNIFYPKKKHSGLSDMDVCRDKYGRTPEWRKKIIVHHIRDGKLKLQEK